MESKLDSILNDPEKMKAAFEMASKIMERNGSSAPPPAIDSNALADTLQKMKSNGTLDNLLSGLSANSAAAAAAEEPQTGGPQAEAAQADEPKKSSFIDMLPNLLQMMGGSASVDTNKANLLKAIKPYVNENRSGSIDRAVNMAGMAKSAKNAIKGFRR